MSDPRHAPAGSEDAWFSLRRFSVLLAVLLALTFPGLMVGQCFFYRDYGFLAYPFINYLRESFWRGELPFWNPYVNCGAPFLAQWNIGVLYPGSLISILLPLPWSLGVFCLAHLFLGGIGMYHLGRRWAGTNFAAATAGILYVFNGITLTSHVFPNYLVTLGWLPWVVWLVERATREGGRLIVAAAFVGAMQMLSGAPEVIFLTWLLLACLVAGQWGLRQLDGRGLARFTFVVLLVTGLTAAQLLPFFELLANSQRDQNFAGTFWAMPKWGIANFFVPLFRCFKTDQGIFVQARQAFQPSYYLGIGTVALAFVAIWKIRRRRVWLLAAATTACVLFAMGDDGVLYPVARKLMPIGFARFPIKAVILTSLLVPLLAAMGIAWFQTSPALPKERHRALVWLTAGLAGIMAAIVLVSLFDPFVGEKFAPVALSAGFRLIFLTGIMILLWWWPRSSASPQNRRSYLVPLAILLLLWGDLRTHSPRQNPTIDSSAFALGSILQYNQANGQLAQAPALGEGRIMLSPSAELEMHHRMVPDFYADFMGERLSLWGNLNQLDHLPKVNGATTLVTREEFQIEQLLYGGTTNDFPNVTDFLGVKYETAPGQLLKWSPRPNPMPLVTAGQRPVFAKNSGDLLARLRDPGFDPRREVLLSDDAKSVMGAVGEAEARISNPHFRDQSVEATVDARAPSLVVVAQSYYPAWKAFVDGHETPLFRANLAYQALTVPSGNHVIRIEYHDRAFQLGSLITILTGLLCAGIAWRSYRNRVY